MRQIIRDALHAVRSMYIPQLSRQKRPVNVKHAFEACEDQPGVGDVAAAFRQRTSNVRVEAQPSQKQARKAQGSTPIPRRRTKKIAKDSASGKIQLPDVELESDEEYETLWALVDSGSSVHALDAEKVFPKPWPHLPNQARLASRQPTAVLSQIWGLWTPRL